MLAYPGRDLGGKGFEVLDRLNDLADGGDCGRADFANRRDLLCDLIRRSPALLSERFYFPGNDREACPRHSRPRGLDRRVQRQQVCLVRNALDEVGDRQDLLHQGGELGQIGVGAFGLLGSVVGELEDVVGAPGQFVDGSRQLRAPPGRRFPRSRAY